MKPITKSSRLFHEVKQQIVLDLFVKSKVMNIHDFIAQHSVFWSESLDGIWWLHMDDKCVGQLTCVLVDNTLHVNFTPNNNE